MNWKQIIVMWIGIIIFVLISLSPPQKTYQSRPSRRPSRGRDAPIVEVIAPNGVDGKLISSWLIVIVLIGGLIYTLRDRDPKDKQKLKEQTMNWKRGFQRITYMLAVIGAVCGFFVAGKTARILGADDIGCLTIAILGVPLGYCLIFLIYWLIEWLILGFCEEPKDKEGEKR